MSEVPISVVDTEYSCVWLPPAVREAFGSISRALQRRRCSQVDYLSKKFQKKFPAYAGYFLDMEAHAHKLRGRSEEAIRLMRAAHEFFRGSNPSTLCSLGEWLLEADAAEQVVDLAEEGRNLFPDDRGLLLLYARACLKQGKPVRALNALETHPLSNTDPWLLYLKADCCFRLGRQAEGSLTYVRATQTGPRFDAAWYNAVFMSHYVPEYTKDDLQRLIRSASRALNTGLVPTPPELLERPRVPDRPLRIGVLSPGFREHPVGWMTAHSLHLLSKLPDVRLYFYNLRENPDADDTIHPLFRAAASKWVQAETMSEVQLYRQLIHDKLDIAVDLTGYGDKCVLPLFMVRIAPIQVKWVGTQCNTTGLPQMDYLLSDRFETPEGCDREYTEKLVRLPHSYVSYELRNYGDPTERVQGGSPFCFACFNNLFKLNSHIAAVWSRILKQVPDSVLLLKTQHLQYDDTRDVVRSLFTDQGIEPERILLEGPSGHKELMQSYCRVDIALDPWPYTGGLTTLEALWMGVPVVTMPGPSFAGRHALSHLCNAGLDSLVANSPEMYVDIAVKLARDPELLKQLRVLLPWSVAQSPLVRHDQLAADLHTAFRTMWQRHCEGLPPAAMRFEQPSEIPEEFASWIRTVPTASGSFDYVDATAFDAVYAEKAARLTPLRAERETPLIVSLTSYPQRIPRLHITLYSLLRQTCRPDRLILWLAEDEFPGGKSDLPTEILMLLEYGLEIRFCENLRSYKKLIPSLREFPDAVIVTADDDFYYRSEWLDGLYQAYQRNPNTLCCYMARRITFDAKNIILPYIQWILQLGDVFTTETSFFSLPIGCCGILYSPYALSSDVLNWEKIAVLAPSGDDLWFWAMAVLKGTCIQVLTSSSGYTVSTWPENELNPTRPEATLCGLNMYGGRNDIQIRSILRAYPDILRRLEEEQRRTGKKRCRLRIPDDSPPSGTDRPA